MPNWVYSEVMISGNKADLIEVRDQLNTPFELLRDNYDSGTIRKEIALYSKPVFAFWNIIKPLNLDAYHSQPEVNRNFPVSWSELTEEVDRAIIEEQDWYHWNIRNWGVKWDVANYDGEKYPTTILTKNVSSDEDGIDFIAYKFETPWDYPEVALLKLAEQYPSLSFDLTYEEEQGWGGRTRYQFNSKSGESESCVLETYKYKCQYCHYSTDDEESIEDNRCEAECESIFCPQCGGCFCSPPELTVMDPFMNPSDLSAAEDSPEQ